MTEKINEGNLYDKIFKENAESIFLTLIESHLGNKILSKKPLPIKLQKTLEREVDYLYDVTLSNKDNFLLHIEFQSKNEKDMIFRMSEYHGILLRKYKKKIVHFVIYVGSNNIKLKTKLNQDEIFDSFIFINLSKLKPDTFLNSKIPQEILLTILTHIEKEQTENTLRSIIKNLRKNSKDRTNFDKFVNQLLVLSRLRKFDQLTNKIIKEMPITIDITKDALYNEGIEKGIEQGIEQEKIKVVLMCHENNYLIKDIKVITGLSIAKIKSIIRSKKM